MALTAAERMAQLRRRQRTAGLATLTLVVPVADVEGFTRLAARRRQLHRSDRPDGGSRVRWAKASRNTVASTSISAADILAFRLLLETTAVSLAVRRLDAAAERRLRAELEREAALESDAPSHQFQRLHLLIGELSGDEPLQLLLRIALQLTDERGGFRRSRGRARQAVITRVKELHAGIVEAMIERSEALTIRRMRRYLSGLRDWLA